MVSTRIGAGHSVETKAPASLSSVPGFSWESRIAIGLVSEHELAVLLSVTFTTRRSVCGIFAVGETD